MRLLLVDGLYVERAREAEGRLAAEGDEYQCRNIQSKTTG